MTINTFLKSDVYANMIDEIENDASSLIHERLERRIHKELKKLGVRLEEDSDEEYEVLIQAFHDVRNRMI